MANLKDLLVTGVAKFLGTVQAKLFKGDLDGTASNASKDDKNQSISSTYIKSISKTTNSLVLMSGDDTTESVNLNQYIDSETIISASNDYPTLLSWLITRTDALVYIQASGFTDLPTTDKYTINMINLGSTSYVIAYKDASESETYTRSISSNAWINPWIKSGNNTGSSTGDSNIVFENVADSTDLNTCIGYSGKITVYRCAGENGFTNTPILDKTVTNTKQGFCISINFNSNGSNIGTDNMWIKQYFISGHCGQILSRYIDKTAASDWAPEDQKFLVIPNDVITNPGYNRSYDGVINYGADLGLPATWYYVKYFGNYINQNGLGFQLFYPFYSVTANTNDGIYYRIGGTATSGKWQTFKQLFTTSGGEISGPVSISGNNSLKVRYLDSNNGTDLDLNYNAQGIPINAYGAINIVEYGSNIGQLRIRQNDSFDVIFRHDGSNFYMLVSEAAGGGYTSARPLIITKGGVCNINGNAATVGGKTISQLITYNGLIPADTLAVTNSPSYEGTINYGANIGLPMSWWHVKNFHHASNDGYSLQLFLPLENGQDSQLMYYRKANANGAAWGALQAVATTTWVTSKASVPYATSAGNAATVGSVCDGYLLGTKNVNGNNHGAQYRLYCQHNTTTNRFRLHIENDTYNVETYYADNAGKADLANGLNNYNINNAAATSAYKNFKNGVAGLSTEVVATSKWSTVFAFNCNHFYNQIGIDGNNVLFYRYNYQSVISESGFTEPFHLVYSDNYKPYVSGYFTYSNTSGNTVNVGFKPSFVVIGGVFTAGAVASYSSSSTTHSAYANITTTGFTVAGGLSSSTLTTSNGSIPLLNSNSAVGYIAFK